MKPSHLFLPALAFFFSSAWASTETQGVSQVASLPSLRVKIFEVKQESLVSHVETQGTIIARRSAQIAPKVMGVIQRLPYGLGQKVKAGDLLALLQVGEIEARVLQARAQLNLAKRDLEREHDLLKKQASTAEMVRALEDRFRMTEAMVKEAEVMLSYAELRAPFDGVIARKFSNEGDMASPGMPILNLESSGDFQIETRIPDTLAEALSLQQNLSVSVRNSAESFQAKIEEIAPSAEAYVRSTLVKLSVPPTIRVRSGLYAKIEVPSQSQLGLLVPLEALSRAGQLERVFILNRGKAVLRLVKSGAKRDGFVEIVSGLENGETVLLGVPGNAVEGQSVEILK